MKNKKGFTLVELLVVIAIIALLMGILMPALARVRQIAYRMVCGTNLSGIGKAMMMYSNDYDEELPRAGGRGAVWSTNIPDWQAGGRVVAYGLNATDYSGGNVTITSCFYLLVKYSEVTPKSFVCKGDSGAREFKPADYGAGARDLIDLWDFGPYQPNQGNQPGNHCSYSYHLPFGLHALTTSSEPGMAVAADRNPWIASPSASAKDWAYFGIQGTESIKGGNAMQHQDDGQNVLFLDTHVYFEKRSFCGINDDNIYTSWSGGDIRVGNMPTYTSVPGGRADSLLVHDGEMTGGGGTSPGGGTGGKTGRCFPADTLVWVDGAMVQISKVVPGQMVDKPLSASVATCLQKAVCSHEIESVVEHNETEGPWECYDIVLESGNCISVADSHFFLLDSGKWATVQELASGSKLVSLEGSITVSCVVKRAMSCVGKVYNLKIKNGEQYFVGKDRVAVRDW